MKREQKLLSIGSAELKFDEEKFTFEGYASVFGGLDSYKDTILPGAYTDAVAQFLGGKRVHMFYNHNYSTLPIGKWVEARQDERGLWVKGQFTPGLALAKDVYAAVKHGTIDGLSIGYALEPGDYEVSADGVRTIKRVSHLFEVSVVAVPADSAARVSLDSVKSAIDTITTLADAEALLRDAAGFSRHAATAFVSSVKAAALRDARAPASTTDEAQDTALKTLAALVERLGTVAA